MKMTTMISALAQSRLSRQGRTAKGRHRLPVLPAAILFLIFILPLALTPSVAQSASFLNKWNNIIRQGEQVYKDTIEVLTPPAEEQPEQQQAPAIKPQQSFSKAQVYEAQRLLTKMGYSPGPIDGVYGSATAKAIRAYQAAYGLEQTGRPTDNLLAHMTYTAGASGESYGSASQTPTQNGSGQAAPQASQQDGGMGVAVSAEATGELNYNNLLKLYIAEHGDLLSNDAFAWHYFKIYKAPENKSPACSNLQRQVRDLISFSDLVKREKMAFSQDLRSYENAPTSGVFMAPAQVQVGNYNQERETFTISRVSLSYNKALSPQPGCNIHQKPQGPSYAPAYFSSDSISMPSTADLPDEIRVSREVVAEYQKKHAFDLRDLRAVATVRVEPLPFLKGAGVHIPGEVIGLTVKHPFSEEILAHYTFAGETSEEEPAIAVLSDSLMPMTNYNFLLYAIRDNPDIVSQDALGELTRRQVQAEQGYWQGIDDQIIRTLQILEKGESVTANINTARLVFAYEWQVLRQSDPDLAQELLGVFFRPEPSWEFYSREPSYDPRLNAYVEASIFSRETIGLPDIGTLKAGRRGPGGKLPLADYLLPELTPVMADFLQQSAQAMPDRLRLDISLNAKFDVFKGLLMLAADRSDPEDGKPAKPLKIKEPVSFAADGTKVESAMYLPLPMSAKDRFIYSVPHMNEQGEPRPGIASRSHSAIESWRSILAESRGGGETSIGQVAALALDREVAFPAVSMTREAVERMKGEQYARYTTFPVSGRLILEVERLDIVRLHGLRYGGRQNQQMKNGVLLARVAGLELLDPNGVLIHTFDVGDLTSAAKVVEDEQAAENEAKAAEDAVFEKMKQKVSARREALRNTDVIGIRPGVSVAEAERIIREHMKVGWIGELAADTAIANTRSSDRPYSYFQTYISTDGSEHVALFWHPEISDKLQGVTRTVILPENISDEAVFAQLKEKYGNDVLVPSAKNPAWIWTVDYGDSSKPQVVADPTDEMRFRGGLCNSRSDATFRISHLKIIEGEALTREVIRSLPSAAHTAEIEVWGGRSHTIGKPPVWDPDKWQECGPVVSAEIKSNNLGKSLTVGMYDLSMYAPVYGALVKKKKEHAVGAGSNLTL